MELLLQEDFSLELELFSCAHGSDIPRDAAERGSPSPEIVVSVIIYLSGHKASDCRSKNHPGKRHPVSIKFLGFLGKLFLSGTCHSKRKKKNIMKKAL